MDIEKECALLGSLFHHIVSDLKSSSPAWDDFVAKGSKLHSLLKSTTIALCAFTESIQKLADLATNTKGSTKDVGTALTRICVRQKMVENKLKHFTSLLLDNLISPVQERLEEWKKVASQLEKEHSKDYKRATQDIKKRNTDTLRSHKKIRKGSKSDKHLQLNSVLHDVGERYAVLAETEKSALRNLLVEERSRICFFANRLSPVLDTQVSIMNETSHLSELTFDLSKLCRNPMQLPTSTEQLVQDYITAHGGQSQTAQDSHSSNFSPPGSPTSSGSRKSSMCSMNSLTSSDSRSSGSLTRNASVHQRHCQVHHKRTNSGTSLPNELGSPRSCKSAPVNGTARLSISSHDSGFISTGNAAHQLYSDLNGRPAMTTLISETNESVPEDMSDGVSPVIRGRSQSQQVTGSSMPSLNTNRFSWKDWSKPGPYDIQISGESKNEHPTTNVLPSKVPLPAANPQTQYNHRTSVHELSSHSNYKQHQFTRANTIDGFQMSVSNDTLPPPPTQRSVSSEDDALPPPPPEFLQETPTGSNLSSAVQSGQQVLPTQSGTDYPVMTLNRKNSINSLQYSTSSGYNSQYTTPACSEDTISSQDTGYNSVENYDVSSATTNNTYSTVPRNYHHSNRSNSLSHSTNLRRASTNGLPSSGTIANDIEGTATIRRKPTSKFGSIRRKGNNVPKAVATPTVPNFSPTPVLSTFAPLPNSNSNNNTPPTGDRDVSFTRRHQNVNCDLTLRFQASTDCDGNFPTPTTTPVVSEVSSFYASPRPSYCANSGYE